MRLEGKTRDHDIRTSDIEIGGDVHRIVLGGINVPPGESALRIRDVMMRDYDALRRLLLSHPYGDETMCADLVFDSSHEGADYAHIIMEPMGYPHFSGSNTIATITALVTHGLVPAVDGTSDIDLETPCGIVGGRYRVADGKVEEVVVRGDDAFVIADRQTMHLGDRGPVDYALVWGGVCFVMVEAKPLGIDIDTAHAPEMKELGRAITQAVKADFHHEHPALGRLDPPSFVSFMGELEKTGDRHYRGRGAIYGHPATVFRCPTGTGTAARMALDISRGHMDPDAQFESVSATGSRFPGRVLKVHRRAGVQLVSSSIAAKPYVLATATLHLDFDNPSMREFSKLREIMAD